MDAISNYISEALEELRQVRWPTRQQSIRLSVITLAFTAAAAVVFGVLDVGISQVIRVLVSLA